MLWPEEFLVSAPTPKPTIMLPFFALDRIYVRGLDVEQSSRLHGKVDGVNWRRMSDHVGLTVTLRPGE